MRSSSERSLFGNQFLYRPKDNRNAAPFDFQPLPILVGVTGHRDIPSESVAELDNRVLSQLLQLQKQYPNQPVVVLSSLAEGADRLCVRAALKAGCSLRVPLPMAREEYEKDFSEASRQEFGELLSRADEVFVVGALEPMPENPPSRGYFYRQAGLYMAKHAHALIALWDGEETLHPEGGGTYETVQFMRQENKSICHIPSPRQGCHPPGSIDKMVAAPRWENVYISISSKFNDMHGERDHLVKSVFPLWPNGAKR